MVWPCSDVLAMISTSFTPTDFSAPIQVERALSAGSFSEHGGVVTVDSRRQESATSHRTDFVGRGHGPIIVSTTFILKRSR